MMETHAHIRPEEPPRLIGPYRVLRAVAEGGMASVYAVQDPEDGRVYAAKVLRASRHGALRFGREFRALTRLDHPDVVKVYRYGLTTTGDPYLVMELLDGEPAQAHVKGIGKPGDPARTAESLRILARVAGALDYLHGHGIIHRDLKSTNVLVLADGRVKVLDFGTARLVHLAESLTDPGEFVGTFQYASPEQLTGGGVDARSDLYGLGILAYRLLTGRRPIEGDTPDALARAHLTQVVPPPGELVPGLPAEVSALVSWLLAKHREQRPASARVVLERLAPFVQEGDRAPPPRRGLVRPENLAAVDSFLAGPPGILLVAGPDGSGRDRLVDLAVEQAQRRGMRTVVPDADGLRVGTGPVLVGLHVEEAVPIDVGALNREQEGIWVVAGWGEDALPPVGERVARLRVAPLNLPEVVKFAAERLGVDTLPPELGRRLHAASGGRLRLLETLVDALPPGADANTPLPQLADPEIGLPAEGLDDPARRVLETVALAEGDLDLGAVAWAVDAPEAETRRVIDRLVRARILTPGEAGWRFQLGLAADRIRTTTRVPRRALLCRRLAERPLPPSPRTVGVLLSAGQVDAAARAAVAWSEDPAARGRPADALPVLDRVAARGPDPALFPFWHRLAATLADTRPDAATAAHTLGRARAAARTPEEHAAVEEIAATTARARSATTEELASLSRALAGYTEAGRADLAARVHTRLAEVEVLRGALAVAETHALRGVGSESGRAQQRAWVALAVTRIERGDWAEAEAAAREAVRVAGRGDPWRAHGTLARVLRLQGRFSEARRTLAAVLPRARGEASDLALASLLLGEAELATDLGRFGEARERLAEGRGLVRGEVPARVDAPHTLLRARLMERASDPGALLIVDAALSRALVRGFRTHAARLRGFRGRLLVQGGKVRLGDAEVQAARGELAQAVYGSFALAFDRPDPGTAENPDQLYAGLTDWLQRPHARMGRLDHAVVAVRHHTEQGRPAAAERAAVVARATFAELLALQEPEERESLRIHPGWRAFAGG